MGPHIGDSIVSAVIGISVSVSLARIFATRFNYKINTNQVTRHFSRVLYHFNL